MAHFVKNNNRTKDTDQDTKLWEIVYAYILELDLEKNVDHHNIDLTKPIIRASLKRFYTLILFLYGTIIIFGIVENLVVLLYIKKNKLYNKSSIHSLMINLCLSDIIKCAIVLPLSLFVMLIYNWILGDLMCSFVPMLQDMPFYITTLTFLIMSWERYRQVKNPRCMPLPAIVCNAGTWLASMCLVLPYPIYIIYVDIGKHIPDLEGVGLCIINIVDNMQNYVRGIFFTMYVAPFSLIVYCHMKAFALLKARKRNFAMLSQETASQRSGTDFCCGQSNHLFAIPCPERVILKKEAHTQSYLFLMVVLYGFCTLPLTILRVMRLSLVETYENSGHFDLIYTVFVWIAFLPSCITPLLYCLWQVKITSVEHKDIPTFRHLNDEILVRSHQQDEVYSLQQTPNNMVELKNVYGKNKPFSSP